MFFQTLVRNKFLLSFKPEKLDAPIAWNQNFGAVRTFVCQKEKKKRAKQDVVARQISDADKSCFWCAGSLTECLKILTYPVHHMGSWGAKFMTYMCWVGNSNCPKQLAGYLVKQSQRHRQSLRDPTSLDLPPVQTNGGQASFKFSAASAWNKLPREICELTTLTQFKGKTFIYLINMDSANHTCTI